ncbi:MAG: LppX_LprAFG lipoprotein [Gordonia sp. (in: high G+C Gram-positive bacteria)]|uniref:LppX_LprAFG lipoprotein n=1 Tax=Gordonia sp. (in: high G+C Gram-positive bacteria) TaxID=84139 RepID=UPI0039E48ABC
MKRHRRIRGAVLALGAAAALTLTACGGDPDSDPAPAASDPAAAELLNKAAEATEALTGATLEIAVSGTVQSLNATAVAAEVNTRPTVSGKGTATLDMGGKKVTAPFVYLDGAFYANVDGGGWIDYGDGRSIYDVSRVLDAKAGVPGILRGLEGAKTDGTEDVNGARATKVTGTVPAKTVAALTGATGEEAAKATTPLGTTVWITAEHQVARVVVEPATGTTMTIDVSNWNVGTEVTRPRGVQTPTVAPPSPPASGEPTREPAAG